MREKGTRMAIKFDLNNINTSVKLHLICGFRTLQINKNILKLKGRGFREG